MYNPCTLLVMAYSSIILRKNRQKKNGLCPLHLILRYNGQSEMSLKKEVMQTQWNSGSQRVRKSAPNADLLNSFLTALQSKIDAYIIKQETSGNKIELIDIKRHIQNKSPRSAESIRLVDLMTQYITDNPQKLKSSTLESYNAVLNSLCDYAPALQINELEYSFFPAYESYLQEEGKAVNTISKYMKIIRKMITVALQKGLIKSNPMLGYKRKNELGKRHFLTQDELKLFESFERKTPSHNLVLDVFLFSCYTGLRFSDICLLEAEHVAERNGNFTLAIRMHKTSEKVEIPLSQKAKAIYLTYLGADKKFIFGILNEQKSLLLEPDIKAEISRRNAYFNKVLKAINQALEIEKHISFHVARHTFATIGLTLGIPIEVLSSLLGHKSIKETQIYTKIVSDQKVAAINLWNQPTL